MKERHLCTTLKLGMIFLSAEGGVRSFGKSDFKSRWMEGERKKFYKKLISYCICFDNITLIKTSNLALYQEKELIFTLKGCTPMKLSHRSFSRQLLLSFFL